MKGDKEEDKQRVSVIHQSLNSCSLFIHFSTSHSLVIQFCLMVDEALQNNDPRRCPKKHNAESKKTKVERSESRMIEERKVAQDISATRTPAVLLRGASTIGAQAKVSSSRIPL